MLYSSLYFSSQYTFHSQGNKLYKFTNLALNFLIDCIHIENFEIKRYTPKIISISNLCANKILYTPIT